MARILLIEDDEKVATLVEDALISFNHVVDRARNGEEGLDYIRFSHYELAVVDWMLPGISGYEICKEYRLGGGQIPILFLTAQSEVHFKVQALDTGADDYLCKPFFVDELIARVNGLLRRNAPRKQSILRSGSLALDTQSAEVTINGTPIILNASEFALLKLLMQSPGRIYSADAIAERDDNVDNEKHQKAIRQRVLCLRKKISEDNHDRSIVTVQGQGYKFESKGA